MMEEQSTCNISLDVEPKDKLKTETDPSHVPLRQKCAVESKEVNFPFNQKADSLALLAVYRYARRIKDFLGWESFREDSEENTISDNLSGNDNFFSYGSKEEELAVSEEQKKNNCKQEKKNSALGNLLVKKEICSVDNQDTGTSFPLESDTDNYKKEHKDNEELGEKKCGNICDINSEHTLRNSYYLDIKDFSDYLPENKSQLFAKSHHADKNESGVSTSKEIFERKEESYRSEFILDVEDSRSDKEVSFLNSKLGVCLLDNNINTDMDKTFLQDNEATDSGLALNDEYSIIQDEDKAVSLDKNEKYIKNNEKQDFSSEQTTTKHGDITCQEIYRENNIGNNEPSEQNANIFFDFEKQETEAAKNLTNKGLINETEQNRVILENSEELTELQIGNLIQKINVSEYFEESVPADNCNNLIKTNINKENNMINSKADAPLKADIQSKNEKNKDILVKNIKNSEKQILEEYDEDTVCGLGIFRPRWLQRYATAKVYVILYSVIGIVHGCYYSYLIGTLSTLEKRFAFESKISGVIMIVDEFTPLLLGMIIGYYATKAHRPRMVALGMLMSAGCCFITSMPYFIYGPMKNLVFKDIKINSGTEYCNPNIGTELCDPDDKPQNLFAVLLLIFGSFLKGFGNLAYYAIGLVYLDDNSAKTSTPIYLAIALALRLLGPLVGFLMSSGFLKYYEDPVYDPGFGPDDPRWIGAWWIGFFLQGILLVIFTIPIALFPRRLPSQKKIEKVAASNSEDGLKEIFRGLISALKRLGTNPVFIVLIINTTMKIFGHFGPAIMLPKYMENQFRLSASEASLFSGALTVLCIIVSTILGGFLIWKFRPRIKVLLAGMIITEIIVCVGYLILMIPRCQVPEMLHFGMDEEGLILDSACNRNCDCSTSTFTPFCGSDGQTLYFSPCYAGCTEEVTTPKTTKMNREFSNCSCVTQQQLGSTISEGFCPDENCRSQMVAYLIILFLVVTVANLFTVAATIILLRSVHPNDKSVALGTFETFICLFGFIPFPVAFGALVDSACLVWEKSCGETGNCWFYDMGKYGYLLHGASALFCSFSVVCLITLYFLSSRVRDLYVEEYEEEEPKYVDVKLDTVFGSVTKL